MLALEQAWRVQQGDSIECMGCGRVLVPGDLYARRLSGIESDNGLIGAVAIVCLGCPRWP
jgi:hypothetical protein